MRNNPFIRFLIAGCFIFLANQVSAQLPAIDSMKLIPANPTTNDALKVVCYTTFPSGGCNLNSYHVEQQGNDIFLTMDHIAGMATYICHSVDTIPIDNPGNGTFLLTATITLNDQDVIEDIDYLQFTIATYLGISEDESSNFLVYPNSFENELRFKSNFPVEKVEIHSISGQKINTLELFDPNEITLDVSDLEQGVYIVTLSDLNGNKFTQRALKKNN